MGAFGYAMLQVTRTAGLDAARPGPSQGLALALAGWLARVSPSLSRRARRGGGGRKGRPQKDRR